jgi:protein-S-isoprenylcysteine O-methyltransferase Ste14
MSEAQDSAGVRFPPPLIYVIAFITGVLLDRQWRLAIGADPVRGVAAWLLFVAWVALTASSFRLFSQKRTSIIPARPASALVIAGPYRFTRNPMYVGLALLTIAAGLWADTWWPILLLVPVLLVVERFVIAREERYLHRRFGADYDAYTRQVRRWF